MAERILLLGGTKEAAELAAKLAAEGHFVITSLAGRTKEPRPVSGEVRIGGFGGAAGLAAWCRDHGITRLVDATHPFATQISANAKAASSSLGIPLETHTRPAWQRQEGDKWQPVASITEAVKALPAGATVLLALGSQHIAPFAKRDDVRYIIRMIDAPEKALPFANHVLLLQRPSTDNDKEAALLRDHGVTHIVCRNSGGDGAYAKLAAARELGLDVIMIEREDAS